MPKVGIVISMCNKNELTTKCIDSIYAFAGIECDVVVIDDGSEVPFVDDRVEIVRYEKPHGNTYSMNAGIIHFNNKCDYIVNMDNDVEVCPNAIKCLVDVMEANLVLALAGSARVMNIDGVIRLLGQGVDIRGRAEEIALDSCDTNECHWVSGCCVMLRNSVIREIGMYDKRFKNYCQDFEWCLRAELNGYKNAIVHNSKVTHAGSGTLKKENSTLEHDRDILAQVISCHGMNTILDTLPIDRVANEFGRVTFDTFNKSATAELAR